MHRFRGFLDRHQRVGPVNLVDVDVIGSQPAQRILDLVQDARAAGIAEHASMLPFKAGLGGNEDAGAPAPFGDRLSDNFLGAAEAVDRRRIDDIDAVLQCRPDGRNGLGFVGSTPHPSANGPGAERDGRHFEGGAVNIGELHLHFEAIRLPSDHVARPFIPERADSMPASSAAIRPRAVQSRSAWPRAIPAIRRSRTTLTEGIGTAASSASASARRTSFSARDRARPGAYLWATILSP